MHQVFAVVLGEKVSQWVSLVWNTLLNPVLK